MNKYILISILSALFFVSSCTKDFDKINKNPNSPDDTAPEFLLTNVIVESAQLNAFTQGFRLANYLGQYASSVEFERIDRYEMGTNSDYWATLYHLLADVKSMKEVTGTNDAYAAVGDVMSCHFYSQLTDMWGDVPYTQSLQASESNFTPEYDTQEEIYTNSENGILATLDRAIAVLETTNNSINGDPMYGGDLNKWARFARSLKVRYMMRISNKITDFSELQKLADSGNLMQSNAGNAVVPYTTSDPNRFPISYATEGLYREHRLTQTADSILHAMNDPRLMIYYKPTQKSVIDGNPAYKGLQNGLNRETISQLGIQLDDISLFGSIFRDVPNGIDAQFMQYAELQFALAEAVERGYITGDAETYYRAGIMASMDYYGTDVPTDYFDQSTVALNGSNNIEKILTQKWISLINCGHEAWFNVRRTGFPDLKPGPDNLNNGKYPSRYLYPESEQATNAENYQKAADRIGGDNINSKSWWEE